MIFQIFLLFSSFTFFTDLVLHLINFKDEMFLIKLLFLFSLRLRLTTPALLELDTHTLLGQVSGRFSFLKSDLSVCFPSSEDADDLSSCRSEAHSLCHD